MGRVELFDASSTITISSSCTPSVSIKSLGNKMAHTPDYDIVSNNKKRFSFKIRSYQQIMKSFIRSKIVKSAENSFAGLDDSLHGITTAAYMPRTPHPLLQRQEQNQLDSQKCPRKDDDESISTVDTYLSEHPL